MTYRSHVTNDALEIQDGKRLGAMADFVRCSGCHRLDRSDFICDRIKTTGRGCRWCPCMTFYEPTFVTDKERKRIVKGFYREPDF